MRFGEATFEMVFGERLSNTMRELILCFTQQGLNEFPWAIDLSEFLELKKIEDEFKPKSEDKT